MKNTNDCFLKNCINRKALFFFILIWVLVCHCERNDDPQYTKEIEVMESFLIGKWVNNDIRDSYDYNGDNLYRSKIYYFQRDHICLYTGLHYPAILDTVTWKISYSEELNEYELYISHYLSSRGRFNLYIKKINDTLF